MHSVDHSSSLEYFLLVQEGNFLLLVYALQNHLKEHLF